MARMCKLCRDRFTRNGRGTVCECGWRLDDPCADDHSEFCPSDGRDDWIGVTEF